MRIARRRERVAPAHNGAHPPRLGHRPQPPSHFRQALPRRDRPGILRDRLIPLGASGPNRGSLDLTTIVQRIRSFGFEVNYKR
jgi:hypothetical protein